MSYKKDELMGGGVCPPSRRCTCINVDGSRCRRCRAPGQLKCSQHLLFRCEEQVSDYVNSVSPELLQRVASVQSLQSSAAAAAARVDAAFADRDVGLRMPFGPARAPAIASLSRAATVASPLRTAAAVTAAPVQLAAKAVASPLRTAAAVAAAPVQLAAKAVASPLRTAAAVAAAPVKLAATAVASPLRTAAAVAAAPVQLATNVAAASLKAAAAVAAVPVQAVKAIVAPSGQERYNAAVGARREEQIAAAALEAYKLKQLSAPSRLGPLRAAAALAAAPSNVVENLSRTFASKPSIAVSDTSTITVNSSSKSIFPNILKKGVISSVQLVTSAVNFVGDTLNQVARGATGGLLGVPSPPPLNTVSESEESESESDSQIEEEYNDYLFKE